MKFKRSYYRSATILNKLNVQKQPQVRQSPFWLAMLCVSRRPASERHIGDKYVAPLKGYRRLVPRWGCSPAPLALPATPVPVPFRGASVHRTHIVPVRLRECGASVANAARARFTLAPSGSAVPKRKRIYSV